MSAVPDTSASPSNATAGGDAEGEERRLGLREQFRSWPRAGRWATYAVTVVVLVVVAALVALGGLGALALGVLTLLPLFFIVISMIGIVTSSVWTIGYLTEVES